MNSRRHGNSTYISDLFKCFKVKKEHAEVYDTVAFEVDGEKRDQLMWPPHCIQGTSGAELHNGLVVSNGQVEVEQRINLQLTDKTSPKLDSNSSVLLEYVC